MATKSCLGCGLPLQNTDPNLEGYTPKSDFDEHSLCQRCFRLKHYGEKYQDISSIAPKYEELLKKAIKQHCLIVYMIDLFNIESSMIKNIDKIIKNNPVLIVGNKRDILPKEMGDDKIKQFVYIKLKHENIHPKGVILTSSYSSYGLDELYEALNYLSNKKDVYFIGSSSVGKSSLINAMIKHYAKNKRDFIVTSPYLGTTLDKIDVTIESKLKVIDTPGDIPSDSYLTLVDKNTLKYMIPRNEIKPITFQLNKGQSILIGGLGKVNILEGEKSGYTCYFSEQIDLHRTKENVSNEKFNSLIKQNQIKPITNAVIGVENLVTFNFVLPNKKVDIVIVGVGFISVFGKGQKVSIQVPQKVNVLIRDAYI